MKGLLCVLFVICTPSASCLQFSTFSLNAMEPLLLGAATDETAFASLYICAHNLPDHRIWHGQWPWLQMAKQAFYKVLKDCCGWIFSKSKINRSLKNLLTLFLEIYCCGPGVCARDTCLNFVSLFLHESINWTESPQQLILFSLFVFAPVFPAATCAA